MVEVSIEIKDDKELIRLQGHAGYSKNGEPDIVCSAISILYQTFFYSISRLEMKDIKQDTKKDEFNLECKPSNESLSEYQAFREFFINGLSLLAYSYPDNIKIIKKIPK